MKLFKTAALAMSAAAALAIMSSADAKMPSLTVPAGVIPPHLSVAAAKYFQKNPDAWSSFVRNLSRRTATAVPTASRYLALGGGTWSTMAGAPTGLCSPHLMHDGTVLAQVCNGKHWYRLTPNWTGNYLHGTWTQIADLPVINGTQYAPLYYASGVLPDGRLLVEGGEYNGTNTAVWTSLGAIYSSFTNQWTPVDPPSAVTNGIGDSQSVGLQNGKFMLGACCETPAQNYFFNPGTLTWTATGAPAGYQDEQGYELLPTGKVLTINVWTTPGTQLYSPTAGTWSAGAPTPGSLVDTCGNFEIGPAVVRGNHSVVGFGGDTCGVNPDNTAIMNTGTGIWTPGPTIPTICGSGGTTPCDLADAPAALLPNGKILFAASAGYGGNPTHFFEMTLNTNTISQVSDPPSGASSQGAYTFNFLVLPTGQIMVTDFGVVQFYTPAGASVSQWAPAVSSAPTDVTRGRTYAISGTQLSGRSAGAYYGDDWQSFTNFPLVRIRNNATGRIVYATTKSFGNFSIAANVAGRVNFTVPAGTPTGSSTLYVVANGIPSAGRAITVH